MIAYQAHIFFSGTVQGVGFRYTTLELAKDIGLTGWVKNLADGRVEAVVEGKSEEIKEFINRVKERFDGYIRLVEESTVKQDPQFNNFQIRY